MSQANDNDDNTLDKTSIVQSETFKGRLAAADSAPPSIVMLMGPQGYVGKQWSLSANDIIGRAVESFVFVDDKSVSKSHAKLSIAGLEVTITDLGSTNKTVVNGAFLEPLVPRRLKNNDQIKTGNVIFKFLEQGNIEAVTTHAVYEQSQKDALTGAHSKGALMLKGPEVMKRAEVLNEPLSLIVFDIDYFKKINDTYGHPAGDYILKEISQIVMNKQVRVNDFFARYGGEEFVIILSGSPVKQALEIAERIRTNVANHDFVFEAKNIKVTISLGVATRELGQSDWADLFKRADQALYTSKNNGRNRVSLS